MGKIIITDEYIDFSQFIGIEEHITIFLHNSDTLIIQLGHHNGICAHKVFLDQQYKIYNSSLIQIFKDRGIITGTDFIKLGDTYYQPLRI